MISIIVCSPDNPVHNQKYAQVEAAYAAALVGEAHEMVRISDAASMAEGYNRGVERSVGDILVFSHNDAAPLRPGFGTRLRQHLSVVDVVGGAGTNRLDGPMWFTAGPPHVFGQVCNVLPPQVNLGFGAQYVLNGQVQVASVDTAIIGNESLHVGDIITAVSGQQPAHAQLFHKYVSDTLSSSRTLVLDVKRKMGPEQLVDKHLTVEYPKDLVAVQMFNLSVFGVPSRLVTGIQAIDGFFMAANRKVVGYGGFFFNPDLCEGFHMYDVDASWQAYRHGIKIGVATDLFLGHASMGGYSDPKWKGAADKWMEVYGKLLPPHKVVQYTLTSINFTSLADAMWMSDELVAQTERR